MNPPVQRKQKAHKSQTDTGSGCPCDSGLAYRDCCQPWHGGIAAPSALALMRSRYSAYVLGLAAYIQDTWHSSTRPAHLTLDANTKWLGLVVTRSFASSANPENEAFVAFTARYRNAGLGGGGAVRMVELSRFVREHEDSAQPPRWFYVDGQ